MHWQLIVYLGFCASRLCDVLARHDVCWTSFVGLWPYLPRKFTFRVGHHPNELLVAFAVVCMFGIYFAHLWSELCGCFLVDLGLYVLWFVAIATWLLLVGIGFVGIWHHVPWFAPACSRFLLPWFFSSSTWTRMS